MRSVMRQNSKSSGTHECPTKLSVPVAMFILPNRAILGTENVLESERHPGSTQEFE